MQIRYSEAQLPGNQSLLMHKRVFCALSCRFLPDFGISLSLRCKHIPEPWVRLLRDSMFRDPFKECKRHSKAGGSVQVDLFPRCFAVQFVLGVEKSPVRSSGFNLLLQISLYCGASITVERGVFSSKRNRSSQSKILV
jgi:hypothetical protein